MKRAKLLRAGIYAAALTAAGWGARADVITLEVSATMTPFGSAACAGTGCTLSGDIVINNSSPAPGSIVSEDVIATGFTPSVGPFTINKGFGLTASRTDTFLTINDAAGDVLQLVFSTPTEGSLVGYTGGPLDLAPLNDPNVPVSEEVAWTLISGSLTVPAPSIGSGLPVALAFSGVLLAAKLLRRSRKPRSLGQPA